MNNLETLEESRPSGVLFPEFDNALKICYN